VRLLRYGDEKFHVFDREYETFSDTSKRIALIADMLPVVRFLADEVFPNMHRVLKELDVESLMTSRVLRWISKQIGGQWPDIVAGHVVDKIQ
jgi:hypothetical protein